MSLLDYSKNCIISSSSFVDDLVNYSLKDGQIIWQNGSTTAAYSLKKDLFDSATSDIFWTPEFISDDNLIDNKIISHYGSVVGDSELESGRLGIEDFISFNPKFKNWNVTGGLMTIDWILNSIRSPYTTVAGLHYWKMNSSPITGPIEIFPLYSKIKYNNIEYIKLDNTLLRKLTVKQNVFHETNGSISFNYTGTDADTNISDLGRDVIFTLAGSDKTKLWIPDGDQLLYFLNSGERSQSTTQDLTTRSYISGSLYKYYNIFYNSLTAKEILNSIDTPRSIKKLRLYKKLAHCLATSPFSSEFFASLLSKPSDTIKEAINTYLNFNNSNASNEPEYLTADIKNLTDVLKIISTEYSNYEVVNNNNIVSNNDQLFIKLINKYGAKLKLSNNSNINYIKQLPYGDSIKIDEIGESLVSKDKTDNIITNNKTLILNSLSIKTNLSKDSSSILLQENTKQGPQNKETVYLYNSVKPELTEKASINIVLAQTSNSGSDIEKINTDASKNVFQWTYDRKITNTSNSNLSRYFPVLYVLSFLENDKHFIVKDNSDLNFRNKSRNFLESEFYCVWEKISGPPLKFIDLTKGQTNKQYFRANGASVRIIPSSTGEYVIKCTVSSPFGVFTRIKTIFIVDGRAKFRKNVESADLIENIYKNTYSNGKILDDLLNLYNNLDIVSGGPTANGIPNFKDSRSKLKSFDKGVESGFLHENRGIPIKADSLNVFICTGDSIAIHRNGLFAPINTKYFVERVSGSSRLIENLDNNYFFQFVSPTSNQSPIIPSFANSAINIKYECNDTIIKLDRIVLSNIRNETPECSQCYSLYQPKLKGFVIRDKPRFIRSNHSYDGFALQEYIKSEDKVEFDRGKIISYFYPKISSDFAPPIRTYGGYGNKVLKNNNIIKIESLKSPNDNDLNKDVVAYSPEILPASTGYKLNYKDDYNVSDDIKKYKFCYQQNVMPNGYLTFNKGTFIPNSGWVRGDKKNLTSVLKFNPGARKSFSFTGPSIFGLSNYSNTGTITGNTFSSSITLNINPYIRWDNGGPFCPTNDATADTQRKRDIKKKHFFDNQLNKEFADQIIGINDQYHHGYRILSGGNTKNVERNVLSNATPVNDEFFLSLDELNNNFTYSFNVVGPNNSINFSELDLDFIKQEYSSILTDNAQPTDGQPFNKNDYLEKTNGWNIRNPRINDLKIKDIEVKLNFLNYVNTKNLVIWLEVDYSAIESASIAQIISTQQGVPPAAPPQIKSENIFIDQFLSKDTYKKFTSPTDILNNFVVSDDINISNNNIKNYVKNLIDTNSSDQIGQKIRLYLLNQQSIQNKEYNFSVTFSDSANKHNVLFDENMFSSGVVDPDQNIITHNMSINPSKHTLNYNTYQNSCYSNINKLNRLNLNNNTFHKFAERILFQRILEPLGGCSYLYPEYDSSTTFTLNIAVLEEEDELTPLDNLINNDLYTNISSIDNKVSTFHLYNSLCSWELILHTEDVKKPTPTMLNSLASYGGTDALSSIEYGEEPKYPGYSFIADLKESKFLLPLANMNAPHSYFQDYSLCEYANNDLIGKGLLINRPRFPNEALIILLASLSFAAAGTAGTLLGAVVALETVGQAVSATIKAIINYLAEERLSNQLEVVQRNTFDIDYDGYSFGNSDKILLNISKDGVFWYKTEASIFKLSNTPALPLKEYAIIPQNNKLYKFEYSIVINNSDIIDDIFIPYIISKATPKPTNDTPTEQELEIINNYQDINNSVYDSFDFVTVDEFAYLNRLINGKDNSQQDIFSRKKLGDALIIIDNTLLFYLININDRINLDCEISASRDSNIVLGSIQVTSKALVYKDSRYQTILAVSARQQELASCSSITLPTNVMAFADNSSSTHYSSENISPISLFGLTNNQPPYDSIPELNFSTHSLGSYGDGSPIKNKNILSQKIQINNIESICNQFDSFNNDKYYFNKITYRYLNGTTETVKAKFSAYPVYYDSNPNNIIDNKFYHLYDKAFTNIDSDLSPEKLGELLDNINTSTKNYFSYTKDQPKNLMFLKFEKEPTTSGSPTNIDLEWNTTFMGFLDGDPWTINNTKLTINFEDSQNCQGSNNSIQTASATTTIIPDKNCRLQIEIEGEAELQDSGYDSLLIKLNGSIIAQATSQGGKKLCETGSVFVRKYVESSPLFVGQAYILSVDVTTGDPLFHKDAYYNIIFKFLTPETPQMISIENNYSYTETVHRITNEELNKLKNRLNNLNMIEVPNLDNKIGISNQTTTILKSNSIYYIQQHYDGLESDDTNKTKTYNKLQKLYTERNEILKLLENQTLKNNGDYILNPEKQKYHTGDGGIIPDFKAIIDTDDNQNSDTVGMISISYEKISDNYYWINIDPKQSCSIAEEARPRILKSVKYICDNVNPALNTGGVILRDFNNICPDWNDVNNKEGSINNQNIKIKADSTGTTYIFYDKDSIAQLDVKKATFTGVYGWREQILTRRFRINSEENITKGLPSTNTEFLVTVIETYDIALTPLETAIDKGKADRLTDNKIIESLLKKSIITNDFSGDILTGGLLNSFGGRSSNGFPTRVYNIFNLDDTAELKVQFRKAPRALRGIDAIGTVLRYGENSTYRASNRNALDPLDLYGIGRTESLINHFYEWQCLQINNTNDKIETAKLPEFFQLLNEMIFRAFFGSVDEIEHKNPKLKSLYDFEMIPYEYFTGIPPTP